MTWHPRQLGAQRGRSFVVTGANSGIGFEAARGLVGRGAHVVLAVRDTAKGETAAARLAGSGSTSVVELDLSDLDQVADCARDAARAPRRPVRSDLQRRRDGRAVPAQPAGLRAADGHQPPGSRRAGRRAVAAAACERRARGPGVEHRGARRAAVAADDPGAAAQPGAVRRPAGLPEQQAGQPAVRAGAAPPLRARPVRRSAPSPCTRAPARPTCSPASSSSPVATGWRPSARSSPRCCCSRPPPARWPRCGRSTTARRAAPSSAPPGSPSSAAGRSCSTSTPPQGPGDGRAPVGAHRGGARHAAAGLTAVDTLLGPP